MSAIVADLERAFPGADLRSDVIEFLEHAHEKGWIRAKRRLNPPLWLLAELTYRCPLHCVFCSNPVDFARYGDELSTDDWLRVLRAGRASSARCSSASRAASR